MFGLAIATMILGFSPGPAVFATISRSLTLGLGPTYLFIGGIILGDLVFSLMAMLGLAALAQTFTPLFFILKIIGGSYLLYLGALSLRDSQMPDLNFSFDKNKWKLFTSGFLLTASNPKDLLFFVGFLPLFIDLKQAGIVEITTASIVIVLSFLFTLSVYAIGANAARQRFKSTASVRWLHRVAGILMIGAGIAVITS